jgi:hypothetical protein
VTVTAVNAIRDALSLAVNLPPQFDFIHNDTGFAFQITDEAFNRWWNATILADQASEYVHFHQGTIDGARFACALDYLVNVQGGAWSADIILRAYAMAMNAPYDAVDSITKINAQKLYDSDQVKFLLDCVRSRNRRIAEERISNLTTNKIEELYERSKELVDKEKLDTERLALDSSIRYLGHQTKERSLESERRDKRAVQEAMKRSREMEGDMNRVPSLHEVKHFIAMLVDAHGAEAVGELVQEILPKKLHAQ